MSEEAKKAVAEMVSAVESNPIVQAFADGFRAGREQRLAPEEETAEETEAEE